MKEPIDTAKADSKSPTRVHVRRWQLFLLLPLLLVGHGCGGGGGGGGETDTPTATNAPPAAGTTLPNDLVGQWETTLGYIPGYYTGLVPLSTTDFIGTIAITVYFQADGAYRFDLSSASRYFGNNCFRTTQWSERGGASVAGADLTFTATHASNIITDSCGKFQFIDPAPTGTATYTMTHAQDQTGWPVLHLRIAGGEDLVLEKCRKC